VFKKIFVRLIPWVITVIAVAYAFSGIDWKMLLAHVRDISFGWAFLAVALTTVSYASRARRWMSFFSSQVLKFKDAFTVMMLGFFMNNILPARAGELVRAHTGSRVTGQSRATVLATVAGERLVDGLSISLMFVLFGPHLDDSVLAQRLLIVCELFAVVAVLVVLTVWFRSYVHRLLEKPFFQNKKGMPYITERIILFIDGLAPMVQAKKLPVLILWSAFIWTVEILVYKSVSHAYDANLSFSIAVLFMVVVNFASLIPAAPGGIGVIEAAATAALVSIGIPKELALTMAITQHAIQYLVVGIPGATAMLRWKKFIKQIAEDKKAEEELIVRNAA